KKKKKKREKKRKKEKKKKKKGRRGREERKDKKRGEAETYVCFAQEASSVCGAQGSCYMPDGEGLEGFGDNSPP
ncbi:hypothetical protein, partial [Escherichia coli]|uniref:hypothetical protein n=1 Tax=Escherichia coli TaxID=562 RepID=UPI00237D4AA6